MTMSEILNAIYDLSQSQGFYGRLLRDLLQMKKNDPKRYEAVKQELEAQKFSDAVDMVLYFEQ